MRWRGEGVSKRERKGVKGRMSSKEGGEKRSEGEGGGEGEC